MNGNHDIALWSGVAAFFASLLAVGIFDIIDPARIYEYLASFVIAGITAGSVYAKQRLDDAKAAKDSGTTYQKPPQEGE